MVQSGYDLMADMFFGWKPEEESIAGAPIPLNYNFGHCNIPVNIFTNQIPDPLYLGPRIPTSLQVHKMFGNRKQATACETLLKEDAILSYKTVIPKKLPYKLKHKEAPREFIGMDQKINLQEEL